MKNDETLLQLQENKSVMAITLFVTKLGITLPAPIDASYIVEAANRHLGGLVWGLKREVLWVGRSGARYGAPSWSQ
jgi:hypothetical protein